MKFKIIKLAIASIVSLSVAVSCKKESENIYNMFDVKLTLHQSTPYAVGEDGLIEIGAKDSVLIDYTIESPTADMSQVCLYKTGVTTPAVRIPITEDGKRRSYSGTFKFYAKDLGAGTASYRIWALDKAGVYIGDGYKTITVNILSDIKHFPNRRIYVPDTIGKTNECYISFEEGKTYSYTTGVANAAKIDMGFFRKLDTVYNADRTIKSTTDSINLYSLSTNPLPFTPYDLSTWTKRETLFSDPINGTMATFRTLFGTAERIAEEAKKKPVNKKHIKFTASNQFVYFLTPEGKYGVFHIQGAGHINFDGRKYLNLFIKMPN